MPTLDRAIGPVSATLLVIGGIIGSGIFLTTGVMADALPSASLLMLAWTVGCLFAVFGALTYAEMSTMRSGRCRDSSTAGRRCWSCSPAASPR
jgi:APA family basic amino acid/polyamine antiporter